MNTNTERELERIFISYNRILENLKLLNITTRTNKEITHKDLRFAIDVMNKRHPSCRWKSQNPDNYKHYILIEGFYWLLDVYYQKEKSLIDADIDYFVDRIKSYENLLNLSPKNLWNEDMYLHELEDYFHRAKGTIKNNIIKMNKETKGIYKYYENGKCKISKEGIEWLCKNCFKHKYLELLEKYKMDLTEKYIEAGFPYDIFLFNK